jgi:hypothetical protein
VLITADHGNLEVMTNPDGTAHVAHTTNLVPFILIDPLAKAPVALRDGILADVAPTVLNALGIPQPEAMRGKDLAGGRLGRGTARAADHPGWLGQWQERPKQSNLPGPNARLGRPAPALPARAAASIGGCGRVAARQGWQLGSRAHEYWRGRIVPQDDARLDLAMQDGSFYHNETLCRTLQDVAARKTSLHLIGLLTEKSSHGSIDYPLALLRMAKEQGLEQVFLHLIFDGRSTKPGSAPEMLENLEAQVAEIGLGQIVSGVGRGIALDRDGNYAKTRLAYDALVMGSGKKCIPLEWSQPMESDFLQKLIQPAQTKIAMIIMDGLGGLPLEPGGQTELESACTPNLDALAAQSALGLTIPVAPGITAGSGPGHLGIFGYDPITYEIGRGVLETLGVDFELGPQDVAARGNFCTVDGPGS